MANFLASIFGTELDKVNCSFYFVRRDPSFNPRSAQLAFFHLFASQQIPGRKDCRRGDERDKKKKEKSRR